MKTVIAIKFTEEESKELVEIDEYVIREIKKTCFFCIGKKTCESIWIRTDCFRHRIL